LRAPIKEILGAGFIPDYPSDSAAQGGASVAPLEENVSSENVIFVGAPTFNRIISPPVPPPPPLADAHCTRA